MTKRGFRAAGRARRPRALRGPGGTGCGTYVFPLVHKTRISAGAVFFFQLSYNDGPQTGLGSYTLLKVIEDPRELCHMWVMCTDIYCIRNLN